MKNLGYKLAAQATLAADDVKDKMQNALDSAKQKQEGAVAFEYIIILVLMVAIIVAAFIILRPVIIDKAQEINSFVSGVDIATGTVPFN